VLSRGGFDAEVVVTTGPEHATHATRLACSQGVELVVAWGGDGTMNEVACALAFGPVPLALVPAGSGNGLARDLGVPLRPDEALAIAASGRRWRIDAGDVNGRLFFNVAGVGLDARIARAFAERTGRRRGLLAYAHVGIRELSRYRAEHYDVRWDAADTSLKALFIALANSRQYGSHGCIAPHAALDDGRLDLVLVGEQPLWRVLTRVPEFFGGRLAATGGVQMHPFQSAELTSTGPWELHLDGEPRAMDGPLAVRVHPGALTVVSPLPGAR
jgi:YegS/Rv2252/BmrU family lipid kinase